MTRKCGRCGRKIEREIDGRWKDFTGILSFCCLTLDDYHIPEKKKKTATCKYCGREITKKGKNWKDNSPIIRKYCFKLRSGTYRKHKPVK